MRSTTVSLRDCVYGQAVGDALGVPFEFRARGTFECTGMVGNGTHGQPAGTWSDDTSMMLAICDSYRELGRIDVDDIRVKFLLWYRESAYTCGRLFDIGAATASALRLGHGLCGERDNGNGSLMRTVLQRDPLGRVRSLHLRGGALVPREHAQLRGLRARRLQPRR